MSDGAQPGGPECTGLRGAGGGLGQGCPLMPVCNAGVRGAWLTRPGSELRAQRFTAPWVRALGLLHTRSRTEL